MVDTTDWFETHNIAPEAFRITEGMEYLPCNSYLLGNAGEWLLIDTGFGIGDLRSLTETLGATTPDVFLTHRHWDHVGAAHQFDPITISAVEQTDGTVSPSTETPGGVELPTRFVQEWAGQGGDFPADFDPDAYNIGPLSGVEPVEPGDTIELGTTTLELVPIPGHSPGQLAVLDRASGICYGADIISTDRTMLAQFPDSDLDSYATSVKRLQDYRDDGAFDTLATGHGEPRRNGELDVLDDMADALQAIRTGEVPPVQETGMWGDIHRYSTHDIDVLAQAP